MRVSILVAISLSVAALASPSTIAQSEPPVVLKLVGLEGPDCVPDALLCFNIVDGNTSTAFVAGQTVRVELTQGAEAPHNINVIMEDDADANHINTATTNAIGTSPTTGENSTVFLTFTVPASGTMYFWCDVGPPVIDEAAPGVFPVGDHELGGMYFTSDVQPAPANTGESGGDQPGNETGGNETGSNNTTPPTNNTTGGDVPQVPTDTGTESDSDNGTAANTTGGNVTVPESEDAPGPAAALAVLGLVAALAVARRRRDG